MAHPQTTNQRRCIVWRCLVVGAVGGAFLTFIVLTFCSGLKGGESSGDFFWVIPWSVVAFPTWGVYKLVGLHWGVGSFSEVPERVFMSMVITNTILSAMIGTAVGLFMKRRCSVKGD
jgi:hypothetical protein